METASVPTTFTYYLTIFGVEPPGQRSLAAEGCAKWVRASRRERKLTIVSPSR